MFKHAKFISKNQVKDTLDYKALSLSSSLSKKVSYSDQYRLQKGLILKHSYDQSAPSNHLRKLNLFFLI